MKYTKAKMASAAVEPIAPVPGFIPGIRPIMLLIRMNRKSEHRNGKCFFQFSPTTPLPISFSTYSMMYSKPLTKKPLGTRACFFLNTARTIRSTIVETISQNEYCVMPQLRSPTTGVELNSLTR